MATSFGALCTDFYIDQKLSLKLDLPTSRETLLHLFDRVRKSEPAMNRLRRYDGELVLESPRDEGEHRWMTLRRCSVRTGHVNPGSMEDGYRLHRMVLEVVPYHLGISPIDVDYLELMFGFDLECQGNHDEVIFEALFHDSAIAGLLDGPGGRPAQVLDVQPLFGMSLSESGDLQAYFEVKTRTKSRRGDDSRYRDEPISLFLTLRRYGPVDKIEDLREIFQNPSVSQVDRGKVVNALATKMGLSVLVKNTVKLLSDRNRTRHLPEVIEAYEKLSQEKAGRVRAEVITATPMPEAYFTQLQHTLEQVTGRKVTLDKREDPSIIGGVVARVGDKVFDGSIRTRLGELKDELLER